MSQTPIIEVQHITKRFKGSLDVSVSIMEFMIRCENLSKMFPAL